VKYSVYYPHELTEHLAPFRQGTITVSPSLDGDKLSVVGATVHSEPVTASVLAAVSAYAKGVIDDESETYPVELHPSDSGKVTVVLGESEGEFPGAIDRCQAVISALLAASARRRSDSVLRPYVCQLGFPCDESLDAVAYRIVGELIASGRINVAVEVF
jgi:hypothetical protein